jgi:transposase
MEPPAFPADRHKAAELLLAGYSIPEAAAKLGRRRETVRRWAQDPVFAGWLSESRLARRQAVASELSRCG